MTANSKPRFDIKALRQIAGDKVFERGEEYFTDGQVEILSVEPGRVLAQVAGTEDYRTVLTGRATKIGGECSCPAFGDWGFCKHMVATALAANTAMPEAAGTLERIRNHLKAKGIDALADMVLGFAERDSDLFRQLDMAAAVEHDDDKSLESRLRRAIDGATLTNVYIDYRAAPEWAAGVERVLATIADLASGKRASLALKLVELAIDRIEESFESIDDSDGHCSMLMEQAVEIHLTAATAARPEPGAFARALFDRELNSDYGAFQGAIALYAEVLGDVGLAEYRRIATKAWEKLPARSGKARQRDEFVGNYHALANILDFFAEREGDIEARIALRAKDLSSPWDYLQLAKFCHSQGHMEEALRRAEEGLWIFEDDRPDERLVLFTVDLLARAKRKNDATALLWRAFEKQPSLEIYNRLSKFVGEAARDQAIKLLEHQLEDAKSAGFGRSVELLVHVLMLEKMFDAAWTVVRKHQPFRSVREELARASEATHPREALGVYAERVEQLASAGGDSSYAEAAKLIGRIAKLHTTAEHKVYVAALKERHGRKRNFMKLVV